MAIITLGSIVRGALYLGNSNGRIAIVCLLNIAPADLFLHATTKSYCHYVQAGANLRRFPHFVGILVRESRTGSARQLLLGRPVIDCLDQEANGISATVDDYFLNSAHAPYCGQAQRASGDSSGCPARSWTSILPNSAVTLSFDVILGQGGGRPLGGPDFLGPGRWERFLANS